MNEIEQQLKAFCADSKLDAVISARVGQAIMVVHVPEDKMAEFIAKYGYNCTKPQKTENGLTYYIYK